ncbi:MAG: ABC transporter ATP-binding protein [Methanomicrobiales archaeon]|nr:ABC transporter ATP-binding protein [Methanomicrobiales archaeon]
MIRAEKISKRYQNGAGEFLAVNEADFTIAKGDFVLVIGRSGSGKSTLLSMLGGLTRPSDGTVRIDDEEIWKMPDNRLSQIRAEKIGFVFQFSGLLPTLTARENVLLPVLFHRRKGDPANTRAVDLLRSFSLGEKLDSYPSQLSGGEVKRVAIARSLMNDPEILLADEPTGDLDVDTEQEIMDLFRSVNAQGKTILVVSHNPDLASFADRIFRMEKGTLVEIT